MFALLPTSVYAYASLGFFAIIHEHLHPPSLIYLSCFWSLLLRVWTSLIGALI